jgi:hypothetical protein
VLRDQSTDVSGWWYVLNKKQGEGKISEIAARDLDRSIACR